MTLDTGISNLFWTLGTVFSLFAELKIFMERWEVLLRRQSREERKNNTSISATPTGCPFVVADPCQHNRIRTPPRSPVHLMGKEIWAGLETRSWSLEHEHLMIWSTFLIWAVQNRLWTMINRKLTKQSYKNRALLMRESEREVRWWMMEPLRSTETHFQSSRINSIDARDSEAAARRAQRRQRTTLSLIIPHPQGGAVVAFSNLKSGCKWICSLVQEYFPEKEFVCVLHDRLLYALKFRCWILLQHHILASCHQVWC